MRNSFFQFKQFTIHQDRCAMKVTTDACLFGAWVAKEIESDPDRDQEKVESGLDIGTGTGLLSLMVIQKNPRLDVLGIEIDKEAGMQAKENIDGSPWKDQITILDGDVKHHRFPEKFDVIISNPPFYEKEIRSATYSKNIAHHSEHLTLEQLLIIIKSYLTPSGSFFLLLPYKRNEEIKRVFKDHQLHISKILLVRQSVKHDYFRIMIKGKPVKDENQETEFDEISIWDEKQEYTPEFVSLLKDYYLHL